MKLTEAYEKARKISARLRSDKHFKRDLLVHHGDGSTMFLAGGYFRKLDEQWLMVAGEHHPVHVYALDEVAIAVVQWKHGHRAKV